MELATQVLLITSALVILSIFAGMLSSRFGMPLLLVFLVLGMLAGEDGPGGIDFVDFQTTYLVGSAALAIILFDGGLRTRWLDLRAVLAPSATLATFGVAVTAAVTGVAAAISLDVSWSEGLLIGSIVASTDAAAVFLLLHLRGMRLRERLRSVLEAEAGLNDPMAVLLTMVMVTFLTIGEQAGAGMGWLETAFLLVRQMGGGILLGLGGGAALLFLLNRANLSAGLYPILAVAGNILLFSGAQEMGASGFLAVYLAGLLVGNRRHKATLLINRFHDGMAWLSQIVMFLLLGLLVTPTSLLPVLLPSLGIAAVLMFVGRPLAVAAVLPLFRFSGRETAFASWVGLRGAVPIYLATIPVLSGIEHAQTYFAIVFVVVLASLLLQGMSIGYAGRKLKVVLPPRPDTPPRLEIDLPSGAGRNLAVYTVQPRSLALRRPLARLRLPEDARLLSVIRDGTVHPADGIGALAPGDEALLITPGEHLAVLDRIFGAPQAYLLQGEVDLIGEFPFEATTPIGAIAEAYGFMVPNGQEDWSVGRFLGTHLLGRPAPGRRLCLGQVELLVQRIEAGEITRVSIEVEPASWTLHRLDPLHIWLRSKLWLPIFRRFERLRERSAAGTEPE